MMSFEKTSFIGFVNQDYNNNNGRESKLERVPVHPPPHCRHPQGQWHATTHPHPVRSLLLLRILPRLPHRCTDRLRKDACLCRPHPLRTAYPQGKLWTIALPSSSYGTDPDAYPWVGSADPQQHHSGPFSIREGGGSGEPADGELHNRWYV